MWTHSSIPFITVIVTLSVPVPLFFYATETLASQTVTDIFGFNSQVTQQFTPCYLFLFSLYLPHRFPGGDPYHCLITRTLFPVTIKSSGSVPVFAPTRLPEAQSWKRTELL